MLRSLMLLLAFISTMDASRDARWREDVIVAREEFLSKDRSFSSKGRDFARRRLDQLLIDVPSLSDQQIVAELARVAALADNGHTRAYLLRNRGWWRRYPVRIWKFSDGWRIIAARPGQEALLGARILRIGSTPIDSAEADVRPLYGGPSTWAEYMATYTLTSPDALLGVGVISSAEATDFEIEKDHRREVVKLLPAQEPKRATPEESWWFLSPEHPVTKGWVQILAGADLPTYLQDTGTWYQLRRCKGDLLYIAFNRSEDQPDRQTLEQFGQQVLGLVKASPRVRLVIDLRFNTGGNLQKTRGLFEQLAHTSLGKEPGRLFGIIGFSTFSAGMTPAAILKQNGKVTLVGSEPGDRLIFWAEGGNVILPNSGINMHYADRAHVYGGDAPDIPADLIYLRLNAGSLQPDRPAQMSFRDYLAGRDPFALRIDPEGLACGTALEPSEHF